MSRTRNARAMRMIGLAALAGLRPIYNTADDKGGGGGDDKTKDKGDDKGKAKEPEKLQLTADELERKISDAKSAAKAEFDKEREKERETKEREELEKKGETQKLL